MYRSSVSGVSFWPAALFVAGVLFFGSVELGKFIGTHILTTIVSQNP